MPLSKLVKWAKGIENHHAPEYTLEDLGLSKDTLDKVLQGKLSVIAYLRMVSIKIAKVQGFVTADDTRKFSERYGIPTNASTLGNVYKIRGFSMVGTQPSVIPSNKGRKISIWIFKGHRK